MTLPLNRIWKEENMEKEFKAKTIEEAKALASQEFGVSADEIDFEILEQPRKGLFGLKGEARVKAVYEAAAAAPAYTAPAKEEAKEEPAAVSYEDDETDESAAVLPEDFDIDSSAKVQAAKKYLTDVLHALGLDGFTITAVRKENNVVLDISGEKLGVVIGRRGETLDSLQYLTILASNRTEESFCRISVDCNGYRDKRRETLENLAKRTSAKVIKQGRKIALEPMNPYERRIIHSCVAEIEGVSSHSTGSEPYRKVVIYADKPKFDNRRRRDGRGERSSEHSRNTRNYRQSSGFSTSFEREYKRRVYEPDENADAGEFSKETVDAERNATLYGKIEL